MIPCGRKDCHECQEAWRYGNYGRIRAGCEVLAARQRSLMFVTLTVQSRPGEDPAGLIDRLSDGFRRWQSNYVGRHHKGAQWFRVFEAGTRNGRPHVHLITDAQFPVVPAPRPGEPRHRWEARLTAEARAFQKAAVAAGLGPIMSVEVAKDTAGVAAYLAGYVAKNDRQLQRPDGRRLRLVGNSRGWPAARPDSTYRVGQVRPAEPDAQERPCPHCEKERQEAARLQEAAGTNEGYAQVRERNIRHWLRPSMLDAGLAETAEALYRAQKEINRAPAGAGGGPEPDPRIVGRIEGLKIRLRAVHQYEGSYKLLRAWRRAGYDIDALIQEAYDRDNMRPNGKNMRPMAVSNAGGGR